MAERRFMRAVALLRDQAVTETRSAVLGERMGMSLTAERRAAAAEYEAAATVLETAQAPGRWDPRSGEPTPEHLAFAVRELSTLAQSEAGPDDPGGANWLSGVMAAQGRLEAVLGRLFTEHELDELYKALEAQGPRPRRGFEEEELG